MFSYPQSQWISFPHYPQSNRLSGDLSTKAVDKFSTLSTEQEPDVRKGHPHISLAIQSLRTLKIQSPA